MMSKKCKYALKALIRLGKEYDSGLVLTDDIAKSEHIPKKFLEQILLHLRNEGLLTSKRGVGGGYSLRKRPSDIVVLDIVEMLDGPIAPLPCALDRPTEPCGCPDPMRCPLRPLQ